jgi:cystathionine beta-lyase
MTIDFNHKLNRRKSDSVKWNRYPEDVLPLWVADTDFAVPKAVQQALLERINHPVFGYSAVQDESREIVCEWLSCRHKWHVSPEDIILLPGVVQGLNIVAKAFTNPGDSLIFHTPAYQPFYRIADNSNLTRSTIQLEEISPAGYRMPDKGIQNQLLPTTRLFYLCNPHNPTGRVFNKEELEKMGEICLRQRMIICSDEIHSDIVYSPHQHIPIASLSKNIAAQTITLISPTKTFNLAGLKISAAVITNPHLRKTFKKYMGDFTGSVNLLGETALRAAYGNSENWLEYLLSYLDDNRTLLADFIEDKLPGVKMYIPEGTYLGWMDFRNLNIDQPGKFLLKNAGVALNEGTWFGTEYRGFCRINFGCPRSNLLEGLQRIEDAL